jgi:alkanesulfonate monooxygenase SsuD/methylene tetrahydromethanopterin reductase-like flavin-dependent oxidoreductase (luciferase family)
MEIGIGLPSTIPGVSRDSVLEWARRADRAGFSTLGTVDRVVYPNWEPLVALAAAAAVTERIRLTTAILLSPLRSNTALFAKQAASIDVLSRGRLVLGLAVGGRQDDYEVSGVDFHRRGRLFDAQLRDLRRVWAGELGVGPEPFTAGGPRIILGGTSDAAIARMAREAEGWVAGGGGPGLFASTVQRVGEAWAAAGREGVPRLAALGYFALGDTAESDARSYLTHYYGESSPYTPRIIAGAAVGEDTVRSQMQEFAEAGCDELILFPCNPDPAQVDLLAAAAELAATA